MVRFVALPIAFMVIFSSIGLRVMHHHCIWCGDHPIEVMMEPEDSCLAESCCSAVNMSAEKNADHHQCCVEILMKIENAIHQVENQDFKLPVINFRTMDGLAIDFIQSAESSFKLVRFTILPPLLPFTTNLQSFNHAWLC